MQARTHINLRKLPLPSRGAIFDTVICLTATSFPVFHPRRSQLNGHPDSTSIVYRITIYCINEDVLVVKLWSRNVLIRRVPQFSGTFTKESSLSLK